MSNGFSQVSVRSRAACPDAAGSPRPVAATSVFDAVSACGRRGAPCHAVSHALVAYWHWLPRSGRSERADLAVQLRDAIKRGTTTTRAWVAIALGAPEFAIVRDATLGYLGTTPVSLERREQSVADVLDWIVRELPLNRAAVFTALLDLNDAAVLERLARLRGRLSKPDAEAVWAGCAATSCEAIHEFIAQWRECCAAMP